MGEAARTTAATSRPGLLFESAEWDFATLERTYDAIADIALNDLGLDVYPNQVEIISSEQMLEAYCSIGMPLMYQHWSFGKRFVTEEQLYRKGYQGLAYEIVINSNPCINYLMEENTMTMQALVMAHAAFGHNHFFKNNELFLQWTDAEGILDYLNFAKGYIAKCEERHGIDAVEDILDAAHAIMDQGVFRYPRHPRPNLRAQMEQERERQEHAERNFNDLWRTLPRQSGKSDAAAEGPDVSARKKKLRLPEENLLYFLEKNSPILETWQRELLRIVRNIAQYFYPQRQTKVMNEGCATFVHYYIMNKLFDEGRITDGVLLETLHSHSNVVFQPGFDDPRYSGINPYALGFAMMQDIKRICVEPSEEDRQWFPDIAGNGDWRGTLRHAWANYRDESFIQQFLSPRLMREFRLFQLTDDSEESHYEIARIHNDDGYAKLRKALMLSFDTGSVDPTIEVTDVDLRGDRQLVLQHKVRDAVPLDESQRKQVLAHVRRLWGYDVRLEGIDAKTGATLYDSVAKAADAAA